MDSGIALPRTPACKGGSDMTSNDHNAKRISPLFNDAFLRIFGGQDSKPVVQVPAVSPMPSTSG